MDNAAIYILGAITGFFVGYNMNEMLAANRRMKELRRLRNMCQTLRDQLTPVEGSNGRNKTVLNLQKRNGAREE